MVSDLEQKLEQARSDRPSVVDRELRVLLRLPTLLLDLAVRLLDFFHVAPRALTGSDPMYTSAFVANLGSIGLDAAYHHLYEHGNCPLFVTLGQIQTLPMATQEGTIEARPCVRLKFTYDERIEDGLYCARMLAHFRDYIEAPVRLSA